MSKYLATTPLTFSLLLFYTSLITTIFEVMSVRLPDIYWNSTNPIFRIDNTDHIIDVNRGNAAFDYDQINIICPMYTKGTREDDIETYIIYNVSKEEYDGCHISNLALARTIAVCDKPYLNRYYTVTFRPFTPQPGGLEFHPGQDYYFIALSAKPGDLSNHCHKYHMKVVFKVCCNKQQQQQQQSTSSSLSSSSSSSSSQHKQQSSQNNRPTIVSKSESNNIINNNNNGILIGGGGINISSDQFNSTIIPIINNGGSSNNNINIGGSTSLPQSSTLLPGQNNNNIATYKGVISNNNNNHHNSTIFPMIIRHHPKPTRSSSIVSNPSSSSSSSSLSDQQSYNSNNNNNNNNYDNRIGGHRFYGDPRGGRYSNIPHYPSLFSTERPTTSSSLLHINSATRIPHVPYHPYHPRQLTSTLRPVHVGWRPHPIPNNHHTDYNPPIRLSDQRIGYKGIYRPNDNREKSDGLNSHSTSLFGQSSSSSSTTMIIIMIVISIIHLKIFYSSSSLSLLL